MKEVKFRIFKEGKKWIVESRNGTNLERSEHTSRPKALAALFVRHPGSKDMYLTLIKGAFNGNHNKE